jgi:hypothetical protein
MSGFLMVLCPLGMVTMGGVAWLLTRLPGRRAERIAQVARRSTCVPVGTSQQPGEAAQSTPDAGGEHEIAECV